MLDTEIQLKLGDIIQIKSATNVKFHLKYFLIEYINDETLKLINIEDGEKKTLEIAERKLIDTTITEIVLLSRSEKDGFAKQHDLVPDTDVKLNFDGEIVVGKVTNLEEDMIEVKTTDDKTLYIDFEYKGVPSSLKEIAIVDNLTVQKSLELKDGDKVDKTDKAEANKAQADKTDKAQDDNAQYDKAQDENADELEAYDDKAHDEAQDKASIEFSPEGNPIIKLPEDAPIDDPPLADLSTVEDDETTAEKSPIQDMLDTLLKRQPAETSHQLVSRFKELRANFAIFDHNGNILGPRTINESYKPLVERLDNLDTNLRWIVPAVNESCNGVLFRTIKTGVAKTDLTTICSYRFDRVIDGETVSLSTLFFLPIQEDSRVDLPTTDILKRTALSHGLKFIALNEHDVVITRVDNINEDVHFEDDAFQKPIAFDVSPHPTADYKSILQSIIPHGVSLINENHIGYSLDQMISFYEPFLLYTDTISAKSEFYKELRKRIQENIKDYVHEYAKGKREMLVDTESLDMASSILLDNVKPELLSRLKKEYKLRDHSSSSELLSRMTAFDNGRFYMSVMSYLMAYLYTPDLADIVIKDTPLQSKSCLKRVVAKKYTSIEDLQKDNGREEVYFDKEFDATPYEILKKHAEAQKNMNNEEFLDYLSVVLKNEHKVDDADLAESLAKTIVLKKKPVEDGNYAVLTIYPKSKTPLDELSAQEKESVEIEADVKKRVSYFIRKHDNWISVQDDDVDLCKPEEMCLFDKNSEFCNVVDNANDRLKRIAKKNLKSEFETTIQITMKEFEEGLAKIFYAHEKNLSKVQKLQKYKDEMFAVRAYKIGAKVAEQEIVTSPYESLRDHILSMQDFAKKQEYIVKFKQTYCREAVINGVLNESIHWYYCKKTNLKLLPAFLFKLAESHDFDADLQQIIKSNGVVVDGAIVDVHSGYPIKETTVAPERDIPSEHGIKREKPNPLCFIVPTRGTDQFVIYTVAKAICNEFETDYQDNIVAHTLRLFTEDITEVKYYANKLNHKTPFHVWKMRNLILVTAAVTFVMIQTFISLPAKIEKKCVAGFPLENSEDMSGLVCMCTVLNDLKNRSGEPWVNIKKHSPEKFLKELTVVIKKHILPDFKMNQMLDAKRAINALVYNKKVLSLFQPPQEASGNWAIRRCRPLSSPNSMKPSKPDTKISTTISAPCTRRLLRTLTRMLMRGETKTFVFYM